MDSFGTATPVNASQIWSARSGDTAASLSYPTVNTSYGSSTWYQLAQSWRSTVGANASNWNWRLVGDTLPANLPVPFSVGAIYPAHVVFRSRAQTAESSSDPNASNDTLVRADLQDHYTPWWSPITPAYTARRPSRAVLAQYNVRTVRIPQISVGRFPCPVPRAEVVGRNRVVIYPIDKSSGLGFAEGYYPQIPSGAQTYGIMVGILDVRQGVLTGLERTEGGLTEVPTADSVSIASTPLGEDGWPDLFAFGGINADGSYSPDLFYTTHAIQTDGTVKFLWHRAVSTHQPAGRRDAVLVLNATSRRVYLFGGRNASGALGDAWAYDMGSHDWVQLELTQSISNRYDAGAVVLQDRVFIGGGISASGGALGDLYELNGLTGGVRSHGNVLPTGGRPSLSFDEHYDGLVYGGGYVGATWYRDVWRVPLTANGATTAQFVYDFGGAGMAASPDYVVHADLEHGLYWGLPGYASSLPKVYVVRDGVATTAGSGGPALLEASGGASLGSSASLARRRNPRGAPVAAPVDDPRHRSEIPR